MTETHSPSTSSPCEAPTATLAALALGEALPPDEQERLLSHLLLCAACRRRLDGYAAVARVLPLAAPDAEPSPGLRDRILQAAARERAPLVQPAPPQPPADRAAWEPIPAAEPASPAPARVPSAPRGPGWRQLLRPALGLALAALIALGIGQAVQIGRLETQLAEQQARTAANGRLIVAAFGNDDAVEVRLEPADDLPAASGRVFVSPGEPAAAIYARGLPQLPDGREYQLWIVHDGVVTSAGRFGVTPEGRAWRPLRPEESLGVVERVFVTAEPAGGSARPTGVEVLAGTPVVP